MWNYTEERWELFEGLDLDEIVSAIKQRRSENPLNPMNILDPQSLPSNPGEPSYFTGAVTLKRMAIGPDVAPNKVLRVEFSPGARTNWHTHTGVQILFVAEGRCRFQQWDGPVQEAGVGETIFIPAGEKHWHGATPEAPMVHVALNIDFETEWLEPVSDEQYGG
jgi:quercetin dioxygenase-like cupin family protein